MIQNLNSGEREVVKLASFFKKKAERMIEEKKLDESYQLLMQTCDKLVEQINAHAAHRGTVLSEREQLKKMVQDNAKCPKCTRNTHLKLVGVDRSAEGWKSNKYKCRRCNIEFVWNAPNNPWDMIPYVEKFVASLGANLEKGDQPEEIKEHTLLAIEQMKANLVKLKPVVEASDQDLAELEARETEMADIVNKFRKQLLIEKIRMED